MSENGALSRDKGMGERAMPAMHPFYLVSKCFSDTPHSAICCPLSENWPEKGHLARQGTGGGD